MANTSALTTTMNTLLSVQSAIKTFLEVNKVSLTSEAVTAHPAIATLLGQERSAIVDPVNFNFSALSAPAAEVKNEKKGRAKKEPRDPTLPKRPQTAYFLYLAANRDRIAQESPNIDAKGITKRLTEEWGKVAEEEKQVSNLRFPP